MLFDFANFFKKRKSAIAAKFLLLNMSTNTTATTVLVTHVVCFELVDKFGNEFMLGCSV